MRKSGTRTRLAGAGLTAGAVVAAVLVAPSAAYAAGTAVPTIVPAGGTATIVDSSLNLGTSTPFVVEVQTTACGAHYSTPGTTATTSPFAVTAPTRVNATTISFTVPAGAVAGTNGAVKVYNVCVYDTNNTSTSTQLTTATLGVGTMPTANPPSGPPGGGNTVNITTSTNVFNGVTTVGGIFTTSACPATFGTPAANVTATVTRTSDTAASVTVPTGVTSAAAPTTYNACLYNGNVAASALLTYVPYTASHIALSQISGPSGGGNGLNINSPTSIFAGVATLGVSFTSSPTCGANYAPTANSPTNIPVTASNIRRLANNRIAITVPTLTVANYQLCVYNGNTTSATLLASTPYAGMVVQSATSVTPSAGPALGDNLITVNGNNFPTTAGSITATLGGEPLTDIKPLSPTAFTAIAPAHAPTASAALVITTAAGESVLSSAYSYLNAIEVEPNTAPNTAANIDVIVKGVGFQSVNWNTNNLTGAHIYLVDGVYSPSDAGSGARANPPVAECTNILAFTDNELVCSMQLNRRMNALGTGFYTTPAPRTISVTTANGSRVITTTSTFSSQDIGLTISNNSNVPAGTTIVDVLNATQAVISANAVATGTDASTSIGTPLLRPAVAVGVTQGDDDITATAGTFTSADTGKFVAGTDIPADTTITAVTSNGDGATLSRSITANTNASSSIDVFGAPTALPVPEGAYALTFVSSGTLNANTDPAYSQSVVSSGSTFTVAPF